MNFFHILSIVTFSFMSFSLSAEDYRETHKATEEQSTQRINNERGYYMTKEESEKLMRAQEAFCGRPFKEFLDKVQSTQDNADD